MSLKNDHISVSPPSAGRMVAGLTAVVMACVLTAAFLDYSKKEYVEGYLQGAGGDLRIVSPARGVVAYSAQAGETLVAGQAFATVRNAETLPGGTSVRQAQMQSVEGKSRSVQTELTAAVGALDRRGEALEQQRAMAETVVSQAQAEVATRHEYLALEGNKLARQRKLLAQGMASAQSLEQAEADLLAHRAELQAAERVVTQARGQVVALTADAAANRAQAATQTEQLQRELRSLEQTQVESQRQAEVSIVAPQAATVTALATATGDAVEAGQLLAKLSVANAPLEALLLLPSAAAGRVKVGQAVMLQMRAYPYTSYGLVEAEITQLDTSPLLSDETTLRGNGISAGSLLIKATARIKHVPERLGGVKALRSGMQFSAAVEVERKSFLAWMTWPLLKHFL